VNGNGLDVKSLVSRALYAFIGVTVSGVLAFSVYVVRDLKEESAYQQGHIAKMEVEVKGINDQVVTNTQRLLQIERDVRYLVQMQQVKRSPRGEWE
jgi:hypothetical protein